MVLRMGFERSMLRVFVINCDHTVDLNGKK